MLGFRISGLGLLDYIGESKSKEIEECHGHWRVISRYISIYIYTGMDQKTNTAIVVGTSKRMQYRSSPSVLANHRSETLPLIHPCLRFRVYCLEQP